MVWPCDEEIRHKRCKASNNNEGGREETSRKAQTEVDGHSAERSETTPARPRARTEPRRMEKGNHGDRPRTGIRSAKVSKLHLETNVSFYLINKYVDDVFDCYRQPSVIPGEITTISWRGLTGHYDTHVQSVSSATNPAVFS